MLLPFTRPYCCIQKKAPDREPSLTDIGCCSVTKAVLKGPDTGDLSLNEVGYRPEVFLLANLLKEKTFLNGN